ncbi:MAG: glycosyltransferase [Bacteroidetes bacterium]|nr:glycosyltransferase [Bacteroidota bacterium]
MKISGFTFVRNGVLYDYPFLESIRSLLPLCDELITAVGKSEDNTLEQIESIRSPKIRIIKTTWDEGLRESGSILSQQTNIALDQVSGDWAFYLQADEVLHEKDYPAIKNAMAEFQNRNEVEAILFNYKHFYGSYEYIGDSRRWYRREIRIVRPSKKVRSWGDAQGFRIDGRKLRVKLIDASIYHYGWVKPPEIQQLKQKYFNKLWHSDDWVDKNVGESAVYDYSKGGKLKLFEGTHPAVMTGRVKNQYWQFKYEQEKVSQPFKEKLLDSIENKLGWRIGEYKNYKII